MAVGPGLTVGQILWILGLHADFERDDAENGIVHMMTDGDARGLGSSGQERGELVDQALAKCVVMGELRNREGAIPCGAFAVEDGAIALMRSGDEVLGETLADFLRRCAGRPIGEIIRLGNRRGGGRGKQEGECGDSEQGIHGMGLRFAQPFCMMRLGKWKWLQCAGLRY